MKRKAIENCKMKNANFKMEDEDEGECWSLLLRPCEAFSSSAHDRPTRTLLDPGGSAGGLVFFAGPLDPVG